MINSTTLAPGYRVQLYATDVSGQANSAMSDLIMENLDEYRALGVPVSVVPAVPQYVSVIATGLQFTAGANTASVLSDAANAVVALINGLPPNSTLRRADVLRALSAIPQLIVPHEALTEPANRFGLADDQGSGSTVGVIMRGLRPVGRCWCTRCFSQTDFYQASDHAPEAEEGPIRCWECDLEYGMITTDVDEDGTRLYVPIRRWAIGKEQRRIMFREMRRRTWDDAQPVHQFLHRLGPRP